ncbi:hypothetical protein [Oceanobacillus sp. J11TS1]|uniref:AbrB/MazE/SpoVT family DNA-binding domain-containing protein n=1 Tax=Oceanobacillus sp. J11TS1 TaxID=2807191 RepID=UPI001B24871F|nr:hypothetical protein [Oceanobacillus sp. J11TS1]GIO23773.1 hypothetical protein J11TS1_23540 [Oceanobacillus sp. J11TS1]
MTVKMHRYGGSSAVIVPAYIKKALGIDETTELEVELKENGFMFTPVSKKEAALESDQDFINFLKETDQQYGDVTRRLVDK